MFFYMLTDIGLAALIQLTKLRLCQPDSFILKPDINFCLAAFRLVNDDIALVFIVEEITAHFCSLPAFRWLQQMLGLLLL